VSPVAPAALPHNNTNAAILITIRTFMRCMLDSPSIECQKIA
jgi:hypothetical protein